MNEEWLNNLEESIEDFPDEVRDFIFGQPLKDVKEKLDEQLTTSEQKVMLNNMVMFFLLQGKTEKELDDFIESMAISDDQKLAIRAIIQEKIINELVLIIEANKALDDEANNNSDNAITKKNVAYDSLSDRLKQATIAMPGKRDFNLESAPASAKATAGEAPIDPYHEPIDNE